LYPFLSNGQASADVEFQTLAGIEPPNPEFLKIHAAFAKVLHISGVAEFMNRLQKDDEREVPLFMHPTNDFATALDHRLAILANQALINIYVYT
jgi:hypothetical protein